MRLGFCLFKYFPYGGLQRDFFDTAMICQSRGHEIFVYTLEWTGVQPAGFHIRVLKVRAWHSHGKYQGYVQQLQPLIRQDQLDCVIGFNKLPGLDIYFAADPCYRYNQAQRSIQYRIGARYRHFMAYEESVFSGQTDCRILVIAEAQQAAYQQAWCTPDSRFSMIPPGIHRKACADKDAAQHRQRIRQEFGIFDEEWLLLMVGSGFRTKGLDRCIKAIKALPESLRLRVRMLVFGQDKAWRFRRQIARQGLAGRIGIYPGRDDIPAVMQAADVLLHPAYHEVAGKVILEAVVAGLPVITSEACGYAHYVRLANAGLVMDVPFRQTAFNLQLACILQDSGQRRQWRDNGIRFGQQNDVYRMALTVADEIEKHCGNQSV